MLHTQPVGLGATVHTLAACDWQSSWFAMVKINRSLNLHLAPPSFHPKLRPHDLCFLALTPWHLTRACEKTNISRPKRPPLTEAPETQRGGRAHHSEGPVWLAACLAIGCVGQREQSRRQTPDSQESRVRGEAAEHRRWEFAQESPLCRVTEAQMEQGEKERMRERGCNTTNAHLQKKRERAELGCVAQRRHTIRDSCCKTHFLHSHQHSSLIPGNECVKVSCDSLRVNTVPLCHICCVMTPPFIGLGLVSNPPVRWVAWKKRKRKNKERKKRVNVDPVLHHIHASHVIHTHTISSALWG